MGPFGASLQRSDYRVAGLAHLGGAGVELPLYRRWSGGRSFSRFTAIRRFVRSCVSASP